ncbi:MAG: hypothetical protein K9L78_05045 [Victivallales bacterium]|nr:hypothetical protein [Victivallales bacterium]
MKDVQEIVEFYESIKDKNLLSETSFSLDEYFVLQDIIDEKTEEFKKLVEEKAFDKNFNPQGFQVIYNNLTNQYNELYLNSINVYIPAIRNIPLSDYEIKYNPSYLSRGFNAMALLNGLQDILQLLGNTFPKILETRDFIKQHNYRPDYINAYGYLKYSYRRLTDPDYLKDESYNVTNDVLVEKVGEFIKNCAPKKTLALPIYYKIPHDSYLVKSLDYKNIENPCDFSGVKYPAFDPMLEINESLEVIRSSEMFSNWAYEFSYLFPETEKPREDREKTQAKKIVEEKIAAITTEKPKRNSYSMWIKGVPKDKDKKDEVTYRLYDIFDHIKGNCLKNNWKDFKSLFNKNGTNTRIHWEGGAEVLNFVFRKLGRHIDYNHRKWEVVSYYFNPDNRESLQPNKLRNNSHHKDKSLERKIDELKDTLKGDCLKKCVKVKLK